MKSCNFRGVDLANDEMPVMHKSVESLVILTGKSQTFRRRILLQVSQSVLTLSLQAFLRDLEWGRQQQPHFWKRLHFRRVEKGVRQTLQMLDKDT